jgi:hypothetical protein
VRGPAPFFSERSKDEALLPGIGALASDFKEQEVPNVGLPPPAGLLIKSNWNVAIAEQPSSVPNTANVGHV